MKVKFLLFCMLLSIANMTTVYAAQADQETDMFGNPIDWDRNASGGEDNAGVETNDETIVQDETYSFQEQLNVLKEMEKYETPVPKETGYITVSLAEDNQNWNQENIKVELTRGNASEEIWLYRQAGWSGREKLPVGHYTFYRAQTVDGTFQFSSDKNSFDISNNGNVTLTLTMGVTTPNVLINQDVATPADIDSSNDTQEHFKNNKMIFGLGLIAFVGILMAVRYNRFRGKKGFRNDLLDD